MRLRWTCVLATLALASISEVALGYFGDAQLFSSIHPSFARAATFILDPDASGLKIALSAVAFCGGFFLIVCGFQRAGDASEDIFDGKRWAWPRLIGWFSLALFGGGIAAYVPVYWLSVCNSC